MRALAFIGADTRPLAPSEGNCKVKAPHSRTHQPSQKPPFVFRLRPYGRKNPCAALAFRKPRLARRTGGRGPAAPCGSPGRGRISLGVVAEWTQSGFGSKRFHVSAHRAKGWHAGDPGHGCFRSTNGTDGADPGFGQTDGCSSPRANSRHHARASPPFNSFASRRPARFVGLDELGSPAVR